jgi:hypothetical protein
MNLDLQLEMFSLALDELERDADLVNQVLEITVLDTDDEIDILRYRLPAD